MDNTAIFCMPRVDELLAKGVEASSLVAAGPYTHPRSWGVYQIEPTKAVATRRYRLGNHPVRQRELEREFGKAKLVCLFASKTLAEELAKLLNQSGRGSR